MAGDHDLAGQRLQDGEELHMVGVRAVVAAAPLRPARRPRAGRVAAGRLAAVEVEAGQERAGAAVAELDRMAAAEAVDRPAVGVDADVAQRRRLALHDGAAPGMRLDICVMRGHASDDGLRETGRGLGPEPCRHCRLRSGSRRTADRCGARPMMPTEKQARQGQVLNLGPPDRAPPPRRCRKPGSQQTSPFTRLLPEGSASLTGAVPDRPAEG